MALSGDTAIVGAPDHTVGTMSQAGAAYAFTRSGSSWTQIAEIAASDAAENASFGSAVALSGTTAVVGATGHWVGANMFQGAAYVFAQSGATWTQTAELLASDGSANDSFGSGVALGAGVSLVGAAPYGLGDVYVFDSVAAATCAQDSDCPSAHCVTGVCCGTACAGACQSCLGAETGGVDGTCAAVTNGTACDDDNACTVTDTCHAGACAPGSPKPDGTPCPEGTCQKGICTDAPDGGSGTGGATGKGGAATGGSSGTGGQAPRAPSGCGCRTAGGDGAPPGGVALAMAALAIAARRRRLT